MYKVYQVLEGDNLEKIAKDLGVSIADLLELNGLEKDAVVAPGMFLVVPAKKNLFTKYTVQKGDTLYSIASRYGISVDNLIQINGLDGNEYIYPGQIILVPMKDLAIYVTKEGDTLDNVVKYFKATGSDVLDNNEKIFLLPNQLLIYKKG